MRIYLFLFCYCNRILSCWLYFFRWCWNLYLYRFYL